MQNDEHQKLTDDGQSRAQQRARDKFQSLESCKRKVFGVVGKKFVKVQMVSKKAWASKVAEKMFAESVAKAQAVHEVAAQEKQAEGEPVETD